MNIHNMNEYNEMKISYGHMNGGQWRKAINEYGNIYNLRHGKIMKENEEMK